MLVISLCSCFIEGCLLTYFSENYNDLLENKIRCVNIIVIRITLIYIQTLTYYLTEHRNIGSSIFVFRRTCPNVAGSFMKACEHPPASERVQDLLGVGKLWFVLLCAELSIIAIDSFLLFNKKESNILYHKSYLHIVI